MAYKFTKVKRKVLSGEDRDMIKTYGVAKANGFCDLPKLCKLISARSAMSSADVKSVLDSLNWVMDVELQAGNIVQLGEVGNVRLSISTTGEIEEKDFTAANIRRAKLVFTPGRSLRETVSGTMFQHEEVKTVVETEPCDEQHVP